MINRRGHGNGKDNTRYWSYKLNANSVFCIVDGHNWIQSKFDPSMEVCITCGKFRNKEGE